VSQRLVSLFETLAKKHSRLASQIQQQDSGGSAALTVVSMEDTEQPSDLVRQGNISPCIVNVPKFKYSKISHSTY